VKRESTWKEFWEGKFASHSSDFESDRLTSEREAAIDRLADAELLEFIDPRPGDVVFDAGCGTGGNVLLIHDRVRRIIAMDYAESAVERARVRLKMAGVANAELLQGDITATTIDDRSVNKILCLSVFHYLSDEQVQGCLKSFALTLRPGGVLVIHVKNLASPYLGSLEVMKALLRLLGRRASLEERYRPFGWYVRELASAGFDVEYYNSFNLLLLERMPPGLIGFLQKLELRRRSRFPFNTAFLRRHGADLKFRARLKS
jgi:ubiquinone/menaquinone biosynthesis C-methylase UbiE